MRRRCLGTTWPGLLIVALATSSASLRAGEPLHERIDALVETAASGHVAAPATDGEFLRRATLDLTGMIPTADQAKAFLDDPSPYKRERLIDELLGSPEYVRRMQIVFDLMLMERRPDSHVSDAEWKTYLYDWFSANRPYDQLVRAILAADGTDTETRAAAKFYLDRDGDTNLLTRDIGRLFLGRDMQCAQCHDHPLVDDYKQAHYYGIYAFLNRSYTIQDAKNVMTFAEKADGDVTFTSVFKKDVTHATGPRVLDRPPVEEPAAAPKGQEYVAFPGDKVHSIPIHSRRELLPEQLASGDVPEFRRNIVNRLWALMMGRGIVQPLDMHHTDNPPSHPELLDLLADEFAAMGFDVKAFLRELALTRTYQRSSEPPPGMSPSDAAPERFAVAALKPLSPEQLSWSLMQAVGIVASTRDSVEREVLELDPRFRDITQADPKRERLGREKVESTVFERLKGNTNPFIDRFGSVAGQSQDGGQATVQQALFLSNGDPVQGWLSPSGNNLTGRLVNIQDPSALAEELYLAVLTRRPTPEERDEIARYLDERKDDRTHAVQELAWALVASTEFRFNH